MEMKNKEIFWNAMSAYQTELIKIKIDKAPSFLRKDFFYPGFSTLLPVTFSTIYIIILKEWDKLLRVHLTLVRRCGGSGSSEGKESSSNAGDLGLIPESGRSPGEGNGYPFQYTCLENSMDRGAWWATAHGVAKSWTWLNDYHIYCRVSENKL